MAWISGSASDWAAQVWELDLCLALLLTILAAPLVLADTAHAQREPGTVTLGVQAGSPGGLTAKGYPAPSRAYDGVFTTDGDDFATLRTHHLWEFPLPDSTVYLFAGPGLLIEGRDLQTRDANPQFGLSGEAGLTLFIERFEVFLHVTPSVRLAPEQWPAIGGSVGLRYRLR